jgi:hypothetical protein
MLAAAALDGDWRVDLHRDEFAALHRRNWQRPTSTQAADRIESPLYWNPVRSCVRLNRQPFPTRLLPMVQRLALQLRQTLGPHLALPNKPVAEGAASLILREERGYLVAYVRDRDDCEWRA